MKVFKEIKLRDFDFYDYARQVAVNLSDAELDAIEMQLEETHPDGMNATDINDLFSFGEDTVAQMLGYDDWEHLWRKKNEE